jgi:hypothetical protein
LTGRRWGRRTGPPALSRVNKRALMLAKGRCTRTRHIRRRAAQAAKRERAQASVRRRYARRRSGTVTSRRQPTGTEMNPFGATNRPARRSPSRCGGPPGTRPTGPGQQPVGFHLRGQVLVGGQRVDVAAGVAAESSRAQAPLGRSAVELGGPPAELRGRAAPVEAGSQPGGAVGDDPGQHLRVEGVQLARVVQGQPSYSPASRSRPVLGEGVDIGATDVQAGPLGQVGGRRPSPIGCSVPFASTIREGCSASEATSAADQGPSTSGAGISPCSRAASNCHRARPSSSASCTRP